MELEIARKAFDEIRNNFPSLRMLEKYDEENGLLEILIPEQDGLDFEISLNLQNNDELHIVASSLWVEWFPCTDPDKVNEYIEAVGGILSGAWRILEFLKSRKPVKAELQKPVNHDWETVATWSTFYFPSFKGYEQRVVQNKVPET